MGLDSIAIAIALRQPLPLNGRKDRSEGLTLKSQRDSKLATGHIMAVQPVEFVMRIQTIIHAVIFPLGLASLASARPSRLPPSASAMEAPGNEARQ
jgi:hypothetical protein